MSAKRKEVVSEESVDAVCLYMESELDNMQAAGHDGQDVALGTIAALRLWLLEQVGAENVMSELADLAKNMTEGVL